MKAHEETMLDNLSDASTTEKTSSELPRLSLVYPKHPTYGVDIFISGKEGASDLELLRKSGITTVVNCAVNLDFNFVDQPKLVSDHRNSIHGPGEIRYYKIGLIDGDGNPDTQMLAAHYILRAALEQVLPEKPSYPRRERGGVLVNCRGGRSRSVVVVSLFLHLTLPDQFETLERAIDFVREKREIPKDEWYKAPKPVLAASAEQAAGWARAIESGKA